MNKLLIAMVATCTMFSVTAMEIEITKEHNANFIMELSDVLAFSKRLVKDNVVPVSNPIYVMYNKIEQDLPRFDNDLAKMVKEKSLQFRINQYRTMVDSDPVIQYLLNEMRTEARKKDADFTRAVSFLRTNRLLHAQLQLKKKQPAFSPVWIGAESYRADFMLKNERYPLDESAVRDFMALCVYQVVYSEKVD